MNLKMGPCFAQGVTALWGAAAGKLAGKRVRFFGNQHTGDGKFRFFFMQPASEPLPVAQVDNSPWAIRPAGTTVHPESTGQPLPDGWRRARSSDGKFSVDLPGPFENFTTVIGKRNTFVLRTTDKSGIRYMALFESSGAEAKMVGTFDDAMQDRAGKVMVFNGFPAVETWEASKLHGT